MAGPIAISARIGPVELGTLGRVLTCSPPLTAGVPRVLPGLLPASTTLPTGFVLGSRAAPLKRRTYPRCTRNRQTPQDTHCIFTGVNFGPVRP